jgi:hypothetical protein
MEDQPEHTKKKGIKDRGKFDFDALQREKIIEELAEYRD